MLWAISVTMVTLVVMVLVLQDRVENFGELLCKRNGIRIEDESNPDVSNFINSY